MSQDDTATTSQPQDSSPETNIINELDIKYLCELLIVYDVYVLLEAYHWYVYLMNSMNYYHVWACLQTGP